jgi:hypothetical protein
MRQRSYFTAGRTSTSLNLSMALPSKSTAPLSSLSIMGYVNYYYYCKFKLIQPIIVDMLSNHQPMTLVVYRKRKLTAGPVCLRRSRGCYGDHTTGYVTMGMEGEGNTKLSGVKISIHLSVSCHRLPCLLLKHLHLHL